MMINSAITKKQPKVLVIYAHPESHTSVANQVMIKKISSLSHVTIRDLYAIYPDFFIDVKAEHKLLLEHDCYCSASPHVYVFLPCVTQRVD